MRFETPPGDVDVLLVEPRPVDAELILLALKESGVTHHVRVAGDPREALDFLLRRGRFAGRDLTAFPRLILLSVEAGRPEDLDLLDRLRADERTRLLPVVVLARESDPGGLDRCYARGANSLAIKPKELDEYASVIPRIASYWLQVNRCPAAAEG